MNPALIHLSDIQFGRNNRYEGEYPHECLFQKLKEDVINLSSRFNFKIQSIIISGDIAETGTPQEYNQAIEFLELLVNEFNLEKDSVIIVPGNHDVNRRLCQAERLRAEALSESFEPPYFEKFLPYKEFYDNFYGELRSYKHNLFMIHNLTTPNITVIGLNSCVFESELPEDHYGWIGNDQLQLAINAADDLDADRTKLRIAVMHHNFLCRSDLDDENLRDADNLKNLIQEGCISIILHGHKHIAGVEQIRNPLTGKLLTIIGAGSAGLDGSVLPEHPNQYGILIFSEHERIQFLMRQFSTQAISLSGQGKWIADTTISDNGLLTLSIGSESNSYETADKVELSIPKIIGRQYELQHMYEIYNRVGKGMGAVLFVEGDLGIGKTTIVTSFCDQFHGESSFIWGRFPQTTIRNFRWPPLFGIKQIIKRLLGLPVSGSLQSRESVLNALQRFKLSTGISDLLYSWLLEENDIESTDPQRLRLKLFMGILSLLAKASEENPLLILLDDLQWADEDSLEIIERLVEYIRDDNLRILVLCNFRPEGRAYNAPLRKTLAILSRFSNEAVYNQYIPPMDIHEVEELLKAVDEKISEKEVSQIYTISGGNPFLALETLRYYRSKIHRGARISEIEPEQNICLPPSINSVFESRIMEICQFNDSNSLALVLLTLWAFDGEATTEEITKALPNYEKTKIKKYINDLIDLGLISLANDNQRLITLSSKHLMSVIPECLPKEFEIDLKKIFGSIADSLLTDPLSGRPHEFRARAYHNAGYLFEAIDALENSSRIALQTGAIDMALESIKQSLSLIHEIKHQNNEIWKKEASIRLIEAMVYDRLGEYEHAFKSIEKLQELYDIAESELSLKANLINGVLYTRTGEWNSAFAIFETLYSQIDKLDLKDSLSATLFYASSLYVCCVDIPKALKILENIAKDQRYRQLGELLGGVLAHLSIFHTETGSFKRAEQCCKLAKRYFNKANAQIDLGLVNISLGNLYFDEGNLYKAKEHLENAKKILTSCRYKFGEATAILNQGLLNYYTEDYLQGLELCKISDDMFTELHLDHAVGQSMVGQAWAYAIISQFDKALNILDEAEAIFEIGGVLDVRDEGIVHCARGFIKAKLNNFEEAEREFFGALSKFSMSRDPVRYFQIIRNILGIRHRNSRSTKDIFEQSASEQWLPIEWRTKLSNLASEDRADLVIKPVIRLKPNA